MTAPAHSHSLPETPAPAVATATTRPWVTAVALGLFLCAVVVVGRRTIDRFVVPDEPAAAAWGFIDFRDAVYYPVVAFLDGTNPYDPTAYRATYPVGNIFPVYTPVTLLVHLPFGMLPFVPYLLLIGSAALVIG